MIRESKDGCMRFSDRSGKDVFRKAPFTPALDKETFLRWQVMWKWGSHVQEGDIQIVPFMACVWTQKKTYNDDDFHIVTMGLTTSKFFLDPNDGGICLLVYSFELMEYVLVEMQNFLVFTPSLT